MKSTKLRALLGMAVVALAIPSCIGLDSHRTLHHSTTVGQELQDLEVAYDKGVISRREYDRTRARILDRY